MILFIKTCSRIKDALDWFVSKPLLEGSMLILSISNASVEKKIWILYKKSRISTQRAGLYWSKRVSLIGKLNASKR
jgi:hypothetical protein